MKKLLLSAGLCVLLAPVFASAHDAPNWLGQYNREAVADARNAARNTQPSYPYSSLAQERRALDYEVAHTNISHCAYLNQGEDYVGSSCDTYEIEYRYKRIGYITKVLGDGDTRDFLSRFGFHDD